jgi:Uncharacterised protein family UPF0047
MRGKLALGTWQEIYLRERRQQRYNRELVVHIWRQGDEEHHKSFFHALKPPSS